ncbi:aromatic-ring-hydroxylating dioxygenase subunit beta [Janthinobacterium sp. HLX7-2]|uniref:aromatic-ring-hydroxylating dioxygenase subunit beta n=1 Tax=Janthinobacterium sp. HLX7-2 TaxID=1259331 RepID=UPI003F20F3BA
MNISTESPVQIVDAETERAVARFLGREAMLLDERRYWEWFELLDDDIVYEVPLRSVREFGKNEFVANAWRIRDDKGMIETRIKRLFTGSAWAEDPPSRTVRMVGSLFVELSAELDVVKVESALMLYRHRAQDPHGDTIAARRQDRIRFTENGARLLSRTVILADTVLTTPNLAVIL